MTTTTATATISPAASKRPAPRPIAPDGLTLDIQGRRYDVRPLDPEDPCILRAYRLTKADGTAYDVALTIHGPQCDCPDWTFRRDGIDQAGCKHLKACRWFGLIGATPPRPSLDDITRAALAMGRKPEPEPEPEPARPAPGPAPVQVGAIAWATAISGRLWSVATEEQRGRAVMILNDDAHFYTGRMIEAPGPALAELRAILAADAEPEPVAPVAEGPASPVVASAGEPAPVDRPEGDDASEGDQGDDDADPADWPAWTDADRWTLAPEPEPAGRMTLPEWVEHEARRYDALGHAAGELIGSTLRDLAGRIRFVDARSIAEFEGRWQEMQERAAIEADGRCRCGR